MAAAARNRRNALAAVGLVGLVAAAALAGCAAPKKGEGLTLVLGSLMPLTGALSDLGPDMQNGAKLAVKVVNEAGAGITIQAHYEDDKTSDTAAITGTFNRLVAKGVQAVAGPCCSGVTASILDLAKDNKIVVSTPSATSPKLTLERDNQGYFWRVPPSDAVQGKVLAKLVKENNVTTANLIVVNNAYGNGLADVFKAAFTQQLGVVTKTEKYDEGATTFQSQVTGACATPTPQAIVLVAYIKEGAGILKEMQAQGCLSKVKVFGSEGVYDPQFPQDAGKDPDGKWLAAGVRGTTPQSANSSAYNSRFNAEYGHEPHLYSDASYDAVMYVALAALKAGSTKGEDLRSHLRDVANGPGTKTSDFKQAAALVKDGKDVDWGGSSHDFDFDTRNEPVNGIYSYWEVQADGTMKIIGRDKSA